MSANSQARGGGSRSQRTFLSAPFKSLDDIFQDGSVSLTIYLDKITYLSISVHYQNYSFYQCSVLKLELSMYTILFYQCCVLYFVLPEYSTCYQLPVCTRDRQIVSIETSVYTPSTFYMKSALDKITYLSISVHYQNYSFYQCTLYCSTSVVYSSLYYQSILTCTTLAGVLEFNSLYYQCSLPCTTSVHQCTVFYYLCNLCISTSVSHLFFTVYYQCTSLCNLL